MRFSLAFGAIFTMALGSNVAVIESHQQMIAYINTYGTEDCVGLSNSSINILPSWVIDAARTRLLSKAYFSIILATALAHVGSLRQIPPFPFDSGSIRLLTVT